MSVGKNIFFYFTGLDSQAKLGSQESSMSHRKNNNYRIEDVYSNDND